MTVDRILSLIAIIVSFIAVPASGYLSYKAAVRGEKRKEWNAIVEPILIFLERQRRRLADKKFYEREFNEIPLDKFNAIRRRLSRRKIAKFNDIFSRYWAWKDAIKAAPTHEDGSRDLHSEGEALTQEIMAFLRMR